MAQIVFKNNAQSTLAGSISPTATSCAVAAGQGILFPVPGANQFFVMTFIDAATGLLNEIVHVTAVVGDTMTIVRAQEGTAPQAWAANDLCAELWTAGQCQAMLQQGDQQAQSSNYSVDTGIANAYRGSYTPAITGPVPGMPLRLKIGTNNTGASTFDPGSGAGNIVRRDGSPLIGGELLTGDVVEFIWNGTAWNYNYASPTTAAALAAGTDTQSFITPAQFVAAVNSVTTGMLVPYAGPLGSIPSAYLNCDGAAVSRSAQARLFGIIGTIWGPGDGSTTFNLPNLIGKTLVGVDTAGTTLPGFTTEGHIGGEASHTLTVTEMPSHNHGFTNNNPSVNNAQSGGSNPPGVAGGFATDFTGGGGAHNNVQPSAAIYWLIKN
jgi:microcystin-dependent protein